MEKNFNIRDYTVNDKEELRQLVIESNIFQKQNLERESLDLKAVKEGTSTIFESTLSNEAQHYQVAEIDGQLVGFILVEVSGMYVGRGSIDDLFVWEEYRKLGIGTGLLESGLSWLRSKDVKKVGLGAHKSNLAAIKLYTNAGFHEEIDTYISLEKNL